MSDNIIYQNVFESNDLLLNDSNIQGGVAFSQSVNSGEKLVLGSCPSATVEFSILDLENSITNPQGIEFLYTQCGEQKGYFTVDTAERIKNVGWKITAYDRMIKFEKNVDSFLEKLPNSFSLRELFTDLCSFVGVPAAATPFTNEALEFYKNFEGSEIKGRDVLYWIAEAAGCFGHIADGVPSFAISLYKEYRNFGIGTRLMTMMLSELKNRGYKRTSLAVQKANYAVRMYKKVGFNIIDENDEEYIMVCELSI